MKKTLKPLNQFRMLLSCLIIFGFNTFLNAQTYTQNDAGVMVIDAAYFTSSEVGPSADEITIDNTDVGSINTDYLVMPGVSAYSAANASAPRAHYTVNFNETGTYYIYVHNHTLSTSEKSFWFGFGSPSKQWADWYNHTTWDWFNSNVDKSIDVTATGEQTFTIYQRDMNVRIDKIILVQDAAFDAAAYISSSDLYDIQVDGSSVVGFDAATLTYDVELPTGTTSTTLSGIAFNHYAGVVVKDNGTESGDGSIDVSSGSATATIEVTAEDAGTTTTYTVNFSVIASGSDATLSDLAVDGTTVTGFDAAVTSYDVEMPFGTTSAIVSATLTDASGSYVIKDNGTETLDGTIDLTSGSATATVEVTAQDGITTATYTVNLTVYVKSTDATLASISVDGTDLILFDAATYTYDIFLNQGTASIELGATSTDANAGISGTGTIDVSSGTGSTDLVVTAEDGTTMLTYTVNYAYVAEGVTTTNVQSSDANGLVRINTEDYNTNTVGQQFDAWSVPDTYVLSPDVQKYLTYTSVPTDAPQLQYSVEFTQTGTHYVWAHVYFLDDSGDSFWYGLDNTVAGNDDRVAPWPATYNSWVWYEGKNSINVTETGVKTFSIFERETRVQIDKIFITTNADFAPSTFLASGDLSNLTVDGTQVSGFASDVITYDVELPIGTTEAVLNGISVNDLAQVSIKDNGVVSVDGTIDLTSGSATATVEVTSEDATTTKTYTVNLTVLKSTDATLSDLLIDGTTVTGFASDVVTYDVEFPVGTTSADVTAVTNSTSAVITSGTGTIDLTSGSATVEVLVTAEDGTTTVTYTLNLTVLKSTDATLSDLLIDDTTVAGFVSSTMSYDVELPVGTTSVDVTAVTNSTSAVITSGTGTIDLTSGSATVEVLVTAEDAFTTETYTLNLTVLKSTDATLSDLLIDGATVTGFVSSTMSYDVELPAGTTSVDVTAVTNSTSAVITSGTGTIDLTSGSATVEVLVTAEDATTTETYTLNLTVLKSTDATLSDLLIDGITVTGFASDVVTYDVELPAGTTSVDVTVVTNSTSAVITSGTGTIDLTSGSATVEVLITAEDATTTETYTLNLTVLKSTDATLSDLLIDGTTVTGFVSSTMSYDVELPVGTTSVDVTAVTNSTSAVITSGTGTIDLTSGSATVEVLVTAEDATTTETYALNLTVLKSTDATLSDLLIDGTTVTGFVSSTMSYNVELPAGTSSVDITAMKNSTSAVITSGTGTVDLTSGSATVEVLVTAEDATTTETYTLNLTVVVATGIADSSIENVVVYPNPCMDKLNVTNISNATVSIYNMQGSLMIINKATSSDLDIDVSGLKPGMYILKIAQEKQMKNISFIKK